MFEGKSLLYEISLLSMTLLVGKVLVLGMFLFGFCGLQPMLTSISDNLYNFYQNHRFKCYNFQLSNYEKITDLVYRNLLVPIKYVGYYQLWMEFSSNL